MKIEAMTSLNPLAQQPVVQTLESRLLQATASAVDGTGSKRPDPDFDALYRQLLALEGQGAKAIYEFLQSLRTADGSTPAYPHAQALLAVTLKVMIRLKDDGLEHSKLYQEIKDANALAFNMDLFVQGFMRDVFQPMGDDAWEKSEW